MQKDKLNITLGAFFALVSLFLLGCTEGKKEDMQTEIPNAVHTPTYDYTQLTTDKLYSVLRKGQLLKPEQKYRDTVFFSKLYDQGDDFGIDVVTLQNDTVYLRLGVELGELSEGDKILISWKMDTLSGAGDEYSFYYGELLDETPLELQKTKVIQDNDSISYLISHIGGIYKYGTRNTERPTGTVHLYPFSDSSAIFCLNVCRGAPSYNLGFMVEPIIIKNQVGVYLRNDDIQQCKLLFTFHDRKLTIQTDKELDNCGFGHAVYADGEYIIQEEQKPIFFYNMEGDKEFFRDYALKYIHHNK